MSKINTKLMALGSVALFVTATAAMAGVPANPVLGLSGHTATNAYDGDTGAGVYGLSYGIDGGGATFNANGDLTGLADRATCGATNATCKILDGSGDGMLMYLVTDGSGKKHINQVVGQSDNVNGLFLGELFVEYQLAAQEIRPDLFVAMAAYGDYGPGYIGTAEAYPQGGYETSPHVSLVAPEVEPVLMDAIKRLLRD